MQNEMLANIAMQKARNKIIPCIILMYIMCFLDRSNIGFAKQAFQMDTGISDAAFALGAGIFFIGYAVFEVPSNIIMNRVGAKFWLMRIMVTWGLIAASFAFVTSETQFLVLRVLLGIAEAGFIPAIVYYLTFWFTEEQRSSMMGLFWLGVPLAFVFGSPISGLLLDMHGILGLKGWQWLFAVEGLLASLSGILIYENLSDAPNDVNWLTKEEKEALTAALLREKESQKIETNNAVSALYNPKVWYMCLISFTVQVANNGFNFYFPTLVASLLGVKVGTLVGFVSAIPWICCAIAMVSLPKLSDKTGSRGILAGFIILTSGIGYIISGTHMVVLGIVAMCVVAACNVACQPIYWTMPSRFLSGAGAASGIALINSMGNLGGFVAPNLKTWAEITWASSTAGLYAMAGFAFISAILLWLTVPLKLGNNLLKNKYSK
ncbi:MFS transporter [Pectinatus haikarae]|uniref:MFS family permease n=1 Tax=Pectinatus haikarae TaxID=349096 RepID=A0ABT9Y8B0_9FIRM|nr:MFS transporter [Pectinatus haikarae]MDQ0204047.1 MFS family permease [Pectinatus haikarae]